MSQSRRLAAIMFADIVGYTAMMQRNEQEGLEKVHRFSEIMESVCTDKEGEILEFRGDGCLAIFSSAVQAMHAAREIQDRLQQAPQVPLRIGIHVGDIVFTKGNIYGDGVNLASRVESMGIPGSILFTERVVHDVKSHPEFEMSSLGRFQFKNVEKPMEVFALANEGLAVPMPGELMGKGRKLTHSKTLSFWKSIAGIAFLCSLISIYFYWVNHHSSEEIKPTHLKSNTLSRIAVLPFENISPDPNDVYFAEGMTDELIAKLSKISQLRVIARRSTMSYKHTRKTASQIGEELEVAHLIEGSVRKAGNQLRIHVKLVDVQTQTQIWSEQYDRKLDNVFAIQDSISISVARNLQTQILGNEKASLIKQPTKSLAAYQLYLQGRFHWNKRTAQGLTSSISYFNRALELDPGYALAYAGLADALIMQGFWSFVSAHEVYPKAKMYVEKALELDPELVEALTSKAFIATTYDWEWHQAEVLYKQALRLNPSNSIAHQWYSEHLVIQNKLEEALYEIDQAQSLDPLSQIITSVKGEFLRYKGKKEEALIQFAKVLEFDPDFAVTYTHRASVYVDMGKLDLALADARKAMELSNQATFAQGILGYVYAIRGEKTEAQNILNELLKKSQKLNTGEIYLALIYAGLGDEGNTFKWLEIAAEQRSSTVWFIVRGGPLDPYKENPKFKALLQKGGLDYF